MPSISLFNRQRTHSTPHLPSTANAGVDSDEFGRMGGGGGFLTPTKSDKEKPPTPSKRKKSSKNLKPSTLPTDDFFDNDRGPSLPPKTEYMEYTILPPPMQSTTLHPQPLAPASTTATTPTPRPPMKDEQPYGYLSYKTSVILSLPQLSSLVSLITTELSQRGLTTPLLFSPLALDLNANKLKRLIDSFLQFGLDTHLDGGGKKWALEYARFAGVLELGMMLRWGLARVGKRVAGGPLTKGLIDWSIYEAWRDDEIAKNYPQTHILSLPGLLPNTSHPEIKSILQSLMSLFTLLLPHATQSGLTPSAISTHFGLLVFSPPQQSSSSNGHGSFRESYASYLSTSTALEHVLLSHVRWVSASHKSQGLEPPPKLVGWIIGNVYPPTIQRKKTSSSGSGGKNVRALAVRRNVRFYSSDLVKSGASWASRLPGSVGSGPNGGEFANTREWGRVCPQNQGTGGFDFSGKEKLVPKYSDAFRKRMVLPTTALPQTTPYSTNTNTSPTSATGTTKPAGLQSPTSTFLSPLGSLSMSTSSISLVSDDPLLTPSASFKSLTDMKWNEFENMGFGEGTIKKGEKGWDFDLNESRRKLGPSKRSTLTWSDFSQQGFARPGEATNGGEVMSDELDDVLEFDKSVLQTVQEGPDKADEMHRKLKKSSKNLPAFGWDTTPVTSEEMIEEGYFSVFCDILYGGGVGWMDKTDRLGIGSGGGGEREGSWALVEFRAFPSSGSSATPSSPPPPAAAGADPRTGSQWILFEEFVPMEYRDALVNPQKKTKFSLGSIGVGGGSAKKWKQASTLNGRTYVVGSVPSGNAHRPEREKEFENLLEREKSNTTLRLTMGGDRHVFGSPATATPSSTINTASTMIPISRSTSNIVGGGVGTTKTGVAGPLYKDAEGQEYPRKFDRAPTFPLSGLLSPTSPNNTHANHQNNTDAQQSPRRSKFRIPGSGKRSGGLTMKDLDAVDFETRTMAGSEDDSGSSGDRRDSTFSQGGKHDRRKSRDDAWVDILLTSRERRMGSQEFDSSPRRPDSSSVHTPRKRSISDPADPELEVGRLLLEAGTPPPDLPSPKRAGATGGNRRGGVFEPFGEDVVEVDYAPPKQPQFNITPPEGHADDGEYDHEDMDVPQFDEDRTTTGGGSHEGYEEEEREREERAGGGGMERSPPHARRDSATLPPGALAPSPMIPTTAAITTNGGASYKDKGKARDSGVSALIDLYSKRDQPPIPVAPVVPSPPRTSATSGNPRPTGSRLPVRAGSKDVPLPPAPVAAPVTPPPPPPPPVPAEPIEIPKPTSVPKGILEDALDHSSSAGRYVHGAPLHNLPEEEEEYEEEDEEETF